MFEKFRQEKSRGEKSNEPKNMSRRNFLRNTGGAALGVASFFGTSGVVGSTILTEVVKPGESNKLPDDYWFDKVSSIYEKYGAVSELQLRAAAVVDALGIPSGQTSAIGIDQEGNREDMRKDAIIAHYLTNPGGVKVGDQVSVTMSDFRKMYPKGLPSEVRTVLDPETLNIMDCAYSHQEAAKTILESPDSSVSYLRLPGGIDLFIYGYTHGSEYQAEHGEYLAEMAKSAQIVGIEGAPNKSYGDSMEGRFSGVSGIKDAYGSLMRGFVKKGFDGMFTEVDTRNETAVSFDSVAKASRGDDAMPYKFPDLPHSFFEDYYRYLAQSQPEIANALSSPEGLEQKLKDHSTFTDDSTGFIEVKGGGIRNWYQISSKEGDRYVATPTGLEFGQRLFSDAMASLKLHIMGKMMADGLIKKGPIVDFEGSLHSSSKVFFLRNPQYAAEIVLRSLHELTAGEAVDMGNNKDTAGAHAARVFNDPGWVEITRYIGDLALAKVDTSDPNKTVEPGDNQVPIKSKMLNVWDLYNVDPKDVMPSDEEINEVLMEYGSKIVKEN